MCKILLVDSYLQSLLISAVLSPGWGQEPKGSCLWVWGQARLAEEQGQPLLEWGGSVELRYSLVGWRGGSRARAQRAPRSREIGYGLGNVCVCSWRPGAAVAPQFLILKMHRYPQVSLWLIEEQPNIEVPLLQASWAGCCQVPRLHAPAPCYPRCR